MTVAQYGMLRFFIMPALAAVSAIGQTLPPDSERQLARDISDDIQVSEEYVINLAAAFDRLSKFAFPVKTNEATRVFRGHVEDPERAGE